MMQPKPRNPSQIKDLRLPRNQFPNHIFEILHCGLNTIIPLLRSRSNESKKRIFRKKDPHESIPEKYGEIVFLRPFHVHVCEDEILWVHTTFVFHPGGFPHNAVRTVTLDDILTPHLPLFSPTI